MAAIVGLGRLACSSCSCRYSLSTSACTSAGELRLNFGKSSPPQKRPAMALPRMIALTFGSRPSGSSRRHHFIEQGEDEAIDRRIVHQDGGDTVLEVDLQQLRHDGLRLDRRKEMGQAPAASTSAMGRCMYQNSYIVASPVSKADMSKPRIPYDAFAKIAPIAQSSLIAMGQAGRRVRASTRRSSSWSSSGCRRSTLAPSACRSIHRPRKLGVPQEKLDLVATWEEAGIFSDKECAALAWAEALAQLAGHSVSDAAYAAVRAHFSEEEIVFLSVSIATINAGPPLAPPSASRHRSRRRSQRRLKLAAPFHVHWTGRGASTDVTVRPPHIPGVPN